MKASKGSSRGSQSKGKRYVKNKLMIGDSRPQMGVKPENRLAGSHKVTRSSQGIDNIYADQANKGIRLLDGSRMKKEIRAKSPRAAEVYGSTKKAMKNSYKRPPKNQDLTNNVSASTSSKTTQPGGMKSKRSRPRNKGLI